VLASIPSVQVLRLDTQHPAGFKIDFKLACKQLNYHCHIPSVQMLRLATQHPAGFNDSWQLRKTISRKDTPITAIPSLSKAHTFNKYINYYHKTQHFIHNKKIMHEIIIQVGDRLRYACSCLAKLFYRMQMYKMYHMIIAMFVKY
jgi:hypothetical protein